MDNCEVDSELADLLKTQRHDFINHLQVIHALLQLGRTEKALAYIEKLAQDARMGPEGATLTQEGNQLRKA